MTKLTFTTTSSWNLCHDFGCASLGLAGVCDYSKAHVSEYPLELHGTVLTGAYSDILAGIGDIAEKVYAAIVLFGNKGGENQFVRELHDLISCPVVGGGAAIDPETGHFALITGGGDAAVFLITDERYTYQTETQCIHNNILETCALELDGPRTLLKINGCEAAEYLANVKEKLGLRSDDFEHLTLSDMNHINAHLSTVDGVIKSGRDLQPTMLLRYVAHKDVYEAMRGFYDDPDAIVFGCAGLSGLLDQPLMTKSLGLFLFGEVCTVGAEAEFGNLMLSKLKITQK